MTKFLQNFVKGMGSAINLQPTTPKNPYRKKNAAEALKSDWEKVGKDLRWAMNKVDKEKDAA